MSLKYFPTIDGGFVGEALPLHEAERVLLRACEEDPDAGVHYPAVLLLDRDELESGEGAPVAAPEPYEHALALADGCPDTEDGRAAAKLLRRAASLMSIGTVAA